VTYSIVARDHNTGEMGVAVQSHYFQVGPVVPWALAGVGAVATQSAVNFAYGPLGLDLMKAGYTAEQALKAVTAGDDHREIRQCAMVDAQGNVAAFTGTKCIPAAGHQTGIGYSCQANLMENDTVWAAMARAFEGAKGQLADRLLAALDAAEAEGGDIRGKQSSALLIVKGTWTGRPWEDRAMDLRVEDHPDPVVELHRLVRIRRAYDADADADHLDEIGDIEGARKARVEAFELAPDNVELKFWAGVATAHAGDLDDGAQLIAEAVRDDHRWLETMRRLVGIERLTARQVAELETRVTALAK
jgi:uncharacterized Ntn-hydrolase superfamily protein